MQRAISRAPSMARCDRLVARAAVRRQSPVRAGRERLGAPDPSLPLESQDRGGWSVLRIQRRRVTQRPLTRTLGWCGRRLCVPHTGQVSRTVDPGSVPPGRHWAWISVAGVVLYVAIDACMAVLRPDVSLLHDAESDYGNGAWSWLMDLNFLIRAVSSIAAVLAIAPLVSVSLRARVTNARPMSASRGIGETTGTTAARVGLGLIVAWTLASGLLAFLPDDLRGATVTAHGRVHLLAALVAFASIGVGTIVVSRVCRTPSIGEAPRGSSSASRSQASSRCFFSSRLACASAPWAACGNGASLGLSWPGS